MAMAKEGGGQGVREAQMGGVVLHMHNNCTYKRLWYANFL